MVEGRTAAHQRSTMLAPRHLAPVFAFCAVDGELTSDHAAPNEFSRTLAPTTVLRPREAYPVAVSSRFPKAILSRTFQRLAGQARQNKSQRMAAHWSSSEPQKELRVSGSHPV